MTDFDRPLPLTPRTCDAPGCRSTDIASIDGINGRRCADHPSVFDPSTAVELMRRGLPGASLAYIRWANYDAELAASMRRHPAGKGGAA